MAVVAVTDTPPVRLVDVVAVLVAELPLRRLVHRAATVAVAEVRQPEPEVAAAVLVRMLATVLAITVVQAVRA